MPQLDLASFRQRLAPGEDATWRQELEQILNQRRDMPGQHTDWGLLCEQAGLVNLAFREFQLALRDDRHDAVASFRLAQQYRERGQVDRALRLLEQLLLTDPAREEWLAVYLPLLREEGAEPKLQEAVRRAREAGLPPERLLAWSRRAEATDEDAAAPPLTPTDADCVRFHHLFAGRENHHARQWARPGADAGYTPVEEPLTPALVRQHLLGTCTLGVYPIRLDGTCTFCAVDLDIDRAALEQASGQPERARALRDAVRAEGRRLLETLRGLGLNPLFEDSGYKGRHFWVFLEQPESAEVLHLFGRLLLAALAGQVPPGLHLEFFPKQPVRKGKGLGNLIKVPLGIHRRTGRRALLLDDEGRPLPEPFAALRQVRRVPRAVLYAALERLKGQAPTVAAGPAAQGAEPEPIPPTPPPPPAPPGWTEADFQTDPAMRHLLARCPVLAELKRTVEEHRRLSHEEQLVLIHSVGHLEGGPLAVNHLLGRCVDVGPEKFLKDRLKGNPVSCAAIRKKIPHLTRRVACNCAFTWAADRYPTPVLHLLDQPAEPAAGPPPAPASLEHLAQRYGALVVRRAEIEREYQDLHRALSTGLRALPERTLGCPGGRYVLMEQEGVEELRWLPDASGTTTPVEGSRQAGV